MASSSPGLRAVRGAYSAATARPAAAPPEPAASRTSHRTGSGSRSAWAASSDLSAACASCGRPSPTYASASISSVFGSGCRAFARRSSSIARP